MAAAADAVCARPAGASRVMPTTVAGASVRCDELARVRDLAAGLDVERCAVEHDKPRRSRLEPFDLPATVVEERRPRWRRERPSSV